MSSHLPLTVLMPVKNGAPFLERALKDILAGIQSIDEVLVVDDGSDDATPQILTQLREHDDRIRVIRVQPTGLVGALNLGLRESSHEWVARADADDRYPASRFKEQRNARGPGIAAIVGDYRIVGSRGPLGTIPCALGHPFVALSALNPQRIPHPGIMISKSAALEAGAYEPDEFPAEDLGLWLRLMRVGQFVGVPTVVLEWHMAPGTTSATRQGAQRKATKDLVKMFPDSVIRAVSDDVVQQELARYADAPFGAERTVLLLRDLLSARSRGANVTSGLLSRIAIGSPIRNARAIAGLGVDMRRRARFRAAASAAP